MANILVKKKIHIDILYQPTSIVFSNNSRTIAISNENNKFLSENINFFRNLGWPSNNIKIYSEKNNLSELFEFKNKKENNFYLVKYNKFFNFLKKNIRNSKFIKFIKLKDYNYNFIKNKNYNLIINSENNNSITKKFFYRKIEKNYHSIAYTTLINHKKIKNKTATQIFTKNGPLAFLPLSKNQTSVVFSNDSQKKIEKKFIKKFIEKYNSRYEIKNISEVEKFNIKFSTLRNYYYENILAFGDLIHKVHPLAGQGFNMTIRDVNILSKIIENNISLGIYNGEIIAKIFQESTKHFNFIYLTGIDFISNFFQFDNKLNNKLSEPIFKILKGNSFLNRYATMLSNKGIF